MKYLDALLQTQKIPTDTRGQGPSKPSKPVLSVLSVPDLISIGEKTPPFHADAREPALDDEGNWIVADGAPPKAVLIIARGPPQQTCEG